MHAPRRRGRRDPGGAPPPPPRAAAPPAANAGPREREPRATGSARPSSSGRAACSCVEVECEFPRVRAQPHLVDLTALVLEVGLEQVGGEDVAGEQEILVGLQRVEYSLQRRRYLRDLRLAFRRQIAQVPT